MRVVCMRVVCMRVVCMRVVCMRVVCMRVVCMRVVCMRVVCMRVVCMRVVCMRVVCAFFRIEYIFNFLHALHHVETTCKLETRNHSFELEGLSLHKRIGIIIHLLFFAYYLSR